MPYAVRMTDPAGKVVTGKTIKFKKKAMTTGQKASDQNPTSTVEVLELLADDEERVLHTFDPTEVEEEHEEETETEEEETEDSEDSEEGTEDFEEETDELAEIAKEHGYKNVPRTSRGARGFYKKVFGKLPHKSYQDPTAVLAAILDDEELAPPPKKERKKSEKSRPASVNSGELSERKFGRRERVYEAADDEVSVRLGACETIEEMVELAAEFGIVDVKEKYGHLSNGLIRMNVGNRIRGAMKRKAKAAAMAAAKEAA